MALTARYDLQVELATFDFFNFMPMAMARGATEIVFGMRGWRESIYPVERLQQRFESIIEPGPALFGVPCRIGDDGESIGRTKLIDFVAFARAAGTFPRARSVLAAGSAKYTVTLRHQVKSPWRNSNQEAWRTFAADIGALVIEDYDDVPIHLHERMALYAGAQMNFGITCGPLFLCSVSEYPCMIFGYGNKTAFFDKIGVNYGEPMPWCGAGQITVWEKDDLSTIRQHFEEWRQ